jgi:hypothetical protein
MLKFSDFVTSPNYLDVLSANATEFYAKFNDDQFGMKTGLLRHQHEREVSRWIHNGELLLHCEHVTGQMHVFVHESGLVQC